MNLDALRTEASSCTRCALSQGRTQVVFGNGHPDADLMFVGEAPGLPRGPAGHPVRRPGREAPRQAARRDRADARRRLRREHAQVPPAGEPRPAARGEAPVRAVALRADRADQAEGDRDARQPRDQAADRQGDRDHARPRPAAAGDLRAAHGDDLPDLPPGRRALHAGDAQGARGGLREDPGAASSRRPSRCRRSPSSVAEPEPEPVAVQLGLF